MSAVTTDWHAPATRQATTRSHPHPARRALNWARRRIEVYRHSRMLEGFSDRSLADIGIGRGEIAHAVENGLDQTGRARGLTYPF